jgi:hypothetical protein
VAALLAAFALAVALSIAGLKNSRDASAYQTSVTAAQRDSEVLSAEQFEVKLPAVRLEPFEKLLDTDLRRIDAFAQGADQMAPPLAFPASRLDFGRLATELGRREVLGRERFRSTTLSNFRTRLFSNSLFFFASLAFVLLQSRLRQALDERASIVERLQRAFVSRRRAIRNLDLGSVLISATRGSDVGGDMHDAFSLDGKRATFMVADVSGKGIEAAVDTAFVKYSVRTFFSEDADPGNVLQKFAHLYAQSTDVPEVFVVLFLGTIELDTGVVRYASAGHEPAWVRGGGELALLPPTGPVVGIEDAPAYETRTVQLAAGDAVVVTTDGLTESRDARGAQLGASGVAAWLAGSESGAQATADSLVRRLRRRSRRIADDLAILVVRYAPDPPA